MRTHIIGNPVPTPEQLGKILGVSSERVAAVRQMVSLRLSPAVLEYFKATGPGWQTRIDEVLKKAAEK